ncbi:MAG: hypothetical protein MUF64_24575 [Polyangiaceae bacterium]|nr:hypothetical protein [Polyangiaceae bacterium]
MMISGLVVTLAEDPRQQTLALDALRRDARIQLGEGAGRKLPVVVETTTAEESTALVEALGCAAGVDFVDVIYVDFSGTSGAGA